MSKVVNFSLDDTYVGKMDKIAKKRETDRSKLLRKWINFHYNEEFETETKEQ
ncbi:hypothetical protein LCGC14_0471510 [marine sediment metagenome]|uniref:Ribbon-helix-helix protein CopG domain-containing protein n=1 Tax=marine sediment metagenome TaxID=412755 RepID=A0A0F9SH98_9ZZZZ|nr:MAG: hypothetical protein Lokiarch_25500 [Candidatus Lokiarchaeum sp. GC14_75]HEC37595.1 ribbon-helix-helix protein, CopG family [bacterium]